MKPTHRLKVLVKSTNAKAEVGAGWKNKDGSISIQLNPLIAIQQNPDQVLTLFPVDATAQNSEGAPTAVPISGKPEFFPLPQRGADPYFGLGRSTYYNLETRGLLKLVRVRKPGNLRGKVLVPYADAAALIRSLSLSKP